MSGSKAQREALGIPTGWKVYSAFPFAGVNQSASRTAIDDKEWYWAENFLRINDGNLRTLWDAGPAFYTAPSGRTIVELFLQYILAAIRRHIPVRRHRGQRRLSGGHADIDRDHQQHVLCRSKRSTADRDAVRLAIPDHRQPQHRQRLLDSGRLHPLRRWLDRAVQRRRDHRRRLGLHQRAGRYCVRRLGFGRRAHPGHRLRVRGVADRRQSRNRIPAWRDRAGGVHRRRPPKHSRAKPAAVAAREDLLPGARRLPRQFNRKDARGFRSRHGRLLAPARSLDGRRQRLKRPNRQSAV